MSNLYWQGLLFLTNVPYVHLRIYAANIKVKHLQGQLCICAIQIAFCISDHILYNVHIKIDIPPADPYHFHQAILVIGLSLAPEKESWVQRRPLLHWQSICG